MKFSSAAEKVSLLKVIVIVAVIDPSLAADSVSVVALYVAEVDNLTTNPFQNPPGDGNPLAVREISAVAPVGRPEKAALPTVGASPKNVTEAREVLPLNASIPIEVTELGIVIAVRALFLNALEPIDSTALPIVTKAREVL